MLGNLLAAFTPDASALSTAFVYGPFGEILAESGDSDSYIHRFNGKEQDELTDLSYYGYRYFDPYSLNWTQADPLYRFAPDLAWDQPRRMNLYAFSLNNPLRYVDPDGMNPGRPPGPWAGPNIPVPPALVGAAESAEAVVEAVPVGMEVGGDILSVVPVVGTLGDAVSAAGSFLQGKKGAAAISAAAIFIPFVGSAEAKGAKAIAEEAAEALSKKGSDAAKGARKGADKKAAQGNKGRYKREEGGYEKTGGRGRGSRGKGEPPCSGPNSSCKAGSRGGTRGNIPDPENPGNNLCPQCFEKTQGRPPTGDDYDPPPADID